MGVGSDEQFFYLAATVVGGDRDAAGGDKGVEGSQKADSEKGGKFEWHGGHGRCGLALIQAADGWGGVRLDQYRLALEMDIRETMGILKFRGEHSPAIGDNRGSHKESGGFTESSGSKVSEQRVGNRVIRTQSMSGQEWLNMSRK